MARLTWRPSRYNERRTRCGRFVIRPTYGSYWRIPDYYQLFDRENPEIQERHFKKQREARAAAQEIVDGTYENQERLALDSD